jgi:capsule polysaccharide export protein KpsE/RkpR
VNLNLLGSAFSHDPETKRLAELLGAATQQIKASVLDDLRRVAEGGKSGDLKTVDAEDRVVQLASALAEHALRFAWEHRP